MAKCINCGKEIAASEEKIYGVLQRYHYDDRHDTADMSTGTTTYTPIAIIRAGVCGNCVHDSRGKGLKNSVYAMLAGVVILLISVAAKELEYAGVGALFGIISFVYGAVGLGKAGFSHKDSVQRLLADQKELEPSVVLAPKTQKSIKVERVEGTLSNRHDYRYKYIAEQSLLKPVGKTHREGSRAAALHTLRRWAQEGNHVMRA